MKSKFFEWISERDLQELIGLKRTSTYLLRRASLIRYSKIGRKNYYDLESVRQYLEQNASKISSLITKQV